MESYSGSLQSSSGGGVGGCDDEYDSRAAANVSASSPFSSFLNLPPPPRHQLINNTPMFDQSFSGNRFHNQNPFLNLDMLNWPSSSKPSSEQTPLNNILLPSSSSPPNPQTLFSSAATNSMIRPSRSLPPTTSSSGGTSSASPAGVLVPPVRNSKKRSRASRRAPTTVLTTDTTNFRAMVQEFTGIPPPPFSASSHFPIRMTSSSYNIVRPFAHKMQAPSLLLQQVQHQQQQQQHQQQNAFLSSITSTSNMGIGGGNSGSGNYQMMNHNHHLGDSELGQMIKLYSSPNTNSSNSTTNVLGSSGTSTTARVISNDGQFGLGSLIMGRNVDHLSSQQHGPSRRGENDVTDYSDWDEVAGRAGSTQGGRPNVG